MRLQLGDISAYFVVSVDDNGTQGHLSALAIQIYGNSLDDEWLFELNDVA